MQIGLIASERQAINACLRSLAGEDERFQPLADQYWVARGGSHTDGGAFLFSVHAPGDGGATMTCANKFGQPVNLPGGRQHVLRSRVDAGRASVSFRRRWELESLRAYDNGGAQSLWEWLSQQMASIAWDELAWGLDWLDNFAREGDGEWDFVHGSLNLLRDRRYPSGMKKLASVLSLVDSALVRLFNQAPALPAEGAPSALSGVRRLTWEDRRLLRPPAPGETTLALDTLGFPAEGEESAARWMERAYRQGWHHLIAYNWRGGRFAACGLGANSDGARIDLYGDVGDYAGSGLDGAQVHIHGDGQDQCGQILKRGKLVIYGDVGQTFLYGAKGGEVYVRGSAAGRPLINAVGSPRAVINGTCLDYLAESFMAGDPLRGGGFVILNGVDFDADGQIRELDTPYPGGNLFSLASGGAIYLRDPHAKVDEDQLNGGVFQPLSPDDWTLILPYLQENERLFGISIEQLLTVGGAPRSPDRVYRKVVVGGIGVLHDEATELEIENR